jgi:two-component system chemotaxis response regulator CheB
MTLRVLTVDDSSFFLELLAGIIHSSPGLLHVGSARNGVEAVAMASALSPDVITLDVEMPVMDGLATLARIMESRTTRVIMVSSHTRRASAATIRALALGAADFVTKPVDALETSFAALRAELVEKILALATPHGGKGRPGSPGHWRPPRGSSPRLIVMGASTGGIAALTRVVAALPSRPRGALVAVQHLPGTYAQEFARSLAEACPCPVHLVRNAQLVEPGSVYVAQGGLHLTLLGTVFRVSRGEPVQGHIPSIDVTMESAARAFGPGCCGVLLTGMGRDGARGIGAIRDAGGITIAQDEATSVVFGMPRAAIESGKVDGVMGIEQIARQVAGMSGK